VSPVGLLALELGLVLTAVLVWPAAQGRSGPASRRPRSASEAAEASTVDEVADAVVLLALALRGGAAVTGALECVIAAVHGQVRADLSTVLSAQRWGLPAAEAWSTLSPVWRPVALAWSAAERAGVPPSDLLLSAAQRIRDAEAATREERLERAGVLLVLPLGGLFLPGFVATTIVPVVAHLLGQMR
jgi:Flp pilus assembly protein TadB